MNLHEMSSFFKTIDLLKTGATLKSKQAGVLVRMENELFLVSAPSWTARMNLDDFQALYGCCTFVPLDAAWGIDEKKDEDYYAWRREKQ